MFDQIQHRLTLHHLDYVNPISYAFEAVLANEFSSKILDCAPSNLVPNGPGYNDPAYQGCAFTGAQTGSFSIPGSRYLEVAFTYTRSHLWRNFAVGKCKSPAFDFIISRDD